MDWAKICVKTDGDRFWKFGIVKSFWLKNHFFQEAIAVDDQY